MNWLKHLCYFKLLTLQKSVTQHWYLIAPPPQSLLYLILGHKINHGPLLLQRLNVSHYSCNPSQRSRTSLRPWPVLSAPAQWISDHSGRTSGSSRGTQGSLSYLESSAAGFPHGSFHRLLQIFSQLPHLNAMPLTLKRLLLIPFPSSGSAQFTCLLLLSPCNTVQCTYALCMLHVFLPVRMYTLQVQGPPAFLFAHVSKHLEEYLATNTC